MNEERDARICKMYLAGVRAADCGKPYGIGRQRVQQILKKAGAWKPYAKSDRDQFLGVSVKETTKEKLRRVADKRGISVSKLSSDMLDEVKE